MSISDKYEGVYSVIGPPGTGKTTFLASRVELAISRGERPLVASMTKTAEREVASRSIEGFSREMVGTVHAHAYRTIGRPEIMKSSHRAEWNEAYPQYQLSELDDFGSATNNGDRLAQRLDVLRHQMVPADAWPTDVAGFSTAWQDFKTELDVIDYTDMIEVAYRESPMAPGSPNVIFVDEAQDLSRLEYELIKNWSRWAGGMVIVGDANQALYTFRGADPSIFDDPEVGPDHRGVLGQSYRVPRSVHRVATAWIEANLSTWTAAEYLPRPADGAVEHRHASIEDLAGVIAEAEELTAQGHTVMFCAAANYMVGKITAALRARALPFCNPWRARTDWNPLGASQSRVTASDSVYAFLRPTMAKPAEGDSDGFCWRCGGDGCSACTPTPPQWTVGDLWRWVKTCPAVGLLSRGAKKALESEAKLAKTQTQAGVNAAPLFDLHTPKNPHLGISRFFLPEHLPFLDSYQRGDVDHEQALLWYRSRLSTAKKSAVSYPIDVAYKRGVDAIRKEPKIFVGTIHSFKGSQASVVFLFPDLPYRGYLAWLNGGEGADSVARAFYVAMTRAKERLFVCDRSSSRSVEIPL